MPVELILNAQHSCVILSILSVNIFSDSYHLGNCFSKANLALLLSLTEKFSRSHLSSFSLTVLTGHFIWEKNLTQPATKVYYSKRHTQRSPKVSAWHLLSQRVAFMWNHTEFLGLALSVVSKIYTPWNRILRMHVRVQFPAWLPFFYPTFPSLQLWSTHLWLR